MHNLYIAEISGAVLPFAPDSSGLSSFSSTLRAAEKAIEHNVLRYGRSRSFKVIEIGTNRKPVCDGSDGICK